MAAIVDTTRFNELCRLCATRTTLIVGVHIFQSEELDGQLRKKIESCLPIQVHETDELPKMLCENCFYKLNLLVDFRERTLRTERLLIDLLKEITEADKLIHNQQQIAHEVVPMDHELLMVQNPQLLSSHVHELDLSHLEQARSQLIANENEYLLNHSLQNVNLGQHHPDLTHHELQPNVQTRILVQSGETHVLGLSPENAENLELMQHHHLLPDQFPLQHELNEEISLNLPRKIESNELSNYQQLHIEPEKKKISPKIEDSNSNSLLIDDQFSNSAEKVYIIQENEANYKDYCECSECFSIFNSKELLEAHRKEVHVKDQIKIEEVDLKTANKSSLDGDESGGDFGDDFENDEDDDEEGEESKEEEKTKGGRKAWSPKVCKECGKSYKTNYKLNEHMRKHTGEKPYKCDSCEKEFRSKIGLAQHAAKHTGKYDFYCQTCGKGFQCKSYLMVHQRVHSDDKPYNCTTCGHNFKTKQSLIDHNNRHLGVKPFLCDICGRAFITKGLCKAHQKVHTGLDNRKYSCKVCNKRFVSKSYLQTHLRIHTGEKPFICEVCGKGFLTKVDLRIHTTMHTGEKSYVCESCGKAFARRDALRCHRRSHTGERPYSCDLCGQTFTQFSPMAIHKRLHTGERPYACEHCDKTFVSRSTMMSHAKKHLRYNPNFDP